RAGGPPNYYPVASAAALVSALNQIAGQIISCTFPLSMVPPYPDRVSVTAGSDTVPRDPTHQNGWDFGAGNQSITFYGSWGSRLQSGQFSDVHAIYGCPPVGLGL